jgi:hypothetical protein
LEGKSKSLGTLTNYFTGGSYMPGEDIRAECLRRLLAVATQLEGDSAQAIFDFQSHRERTQAAYDQFMDGFAASDAELLLQTSLDLVRAFEPLNQLCEEISDIQRLIDQNLSIFQALPQFRQISTVLNQLLNRRDDLFSHFPNDLLGELHGYFGQHQHQSRELDGLLDQGPTELKDWWAMWNNDNSPSLANALQFIRQDNYQQMDFGM